MGFINILPFPAFDGGRVFFLVVEAIRRKPVNAKFENTCHTIGFLLLLLLMFYITIQDIIRLFNLHSLIIYDNILLTQKGI